jgi:hypothetical protein
MMSEKYSLFNLVLVVVLFHSALASIAVIYPAALMRSSDHRQQHTRMIEWGNYGRNAMPKYLIAAIARNNESFRSDQEGQVVSFSELEIAAAGDGEKKPLYLTDIRRDPKALGWGYLGNVTTLSEFQKALARKSRESGRGMRHTTI